MKKNLTIFLFVVLSNILFAQGGKPQYTIRVERADTVIGTMLIELFPTIAPLHVAYYDSLVNLEFFDSTAFHRVDPGFVIQGGDPNSINGPRDTWGEGDSTQKTIPAEFSGVSHVRGVIGAARSDDPNSASSQFYINMADNGFLTGDYTAFGQVVEGMEVADIIEDAPRDGNDNPIEKIIMFWRKAGHNNEGVSIPQLLVPENEYMSSGVFQRIEWDTVASAIMYTIQIAEDENFTQIFIEKETQKTFTNVSDTELGLKQYFWRVKADNGGYTSDYSETRSFYTSIASPTLILPEKNSVGISTTPELFWETVTGASYYQVRVATKSTFSGASVVIDTTGIIDTSFICPQLEYDTKYYWKVRSYTDTYAGPRGRSFIFTTEPLTDIAEEGIPKEYILNQNYPNPFNPTTMVSYSLKEAGNVELTVYNNLAQVVRTLVETNQSAGSYNVQFDASDLSSGIYFYKLKANNFVDVKKMILIK